MKNGIDVRRLDEWMYTISTAVSELDPGRDVEALVLLRRTLDGMREQRAQLELKRHNEIGY